MPKPTPRRWLTKYERGSIAGAILVGIAFAAAFSTLPAPVSVPQTESPKSSKEPDCKDCQRQKHETIGQATAHDPVAIYTLGLVLVASVQVALFFWQLGYMRDGLKDAATAADAAKTTAKIAADALNLSRTISKRQLRAYVHVEDVKMCLMQSKYDPNIQVIVKNFGSTPARHTTVACQCVQIDSAIGYSFSMKGATVNEVADLAPTQQTTATIIYPKVFWDECKPHLLSKDRTFYVYGRVDYIDAFDDPWYTGFRYKLMLDSDGIPDATSLVVEGYAGNDST
jgi:hypothetical protein